MRTALRLIFIAMPLVLAACGGKTATPTPAAPTTPPGPIASGPSFVPGQLPSAQLLCQILTADDFASMNFVNGLAPHPPNVVSDEPGGAYCVYAGNSGASGGFEFDAFVGSSVADATDTVNTMLEGIGNHVTTPVANCQVCEINANVDGTFGAIVGRNGRFSFSIFGPADNQIRLETLAALILERSRALW